MRARAVAAALVALGLVAAPAPAMAQNPTFKAVSSDGTRVFFETKEQMFGFDLVECADLDEAIEVASKHPVARYGMIEVRPFWPLEAA